MPDTFVAKVATDDRSGRLEAMRPEILSRTRLERVLDETQPYPDTSSRSQSVERMRRAISLYASGNDGFTLEFVHSNAHKAQEVTDRLATLFIEETMKSRGKQVEGAVDFLVTQVNDARRELEEKDEALRVYKEARMGKLPEQLTANLATMQMLQQELRTVEESLIFAREKQEAFARGAGRSAAGAPSGAGAGTTELEELRRQLASMRSRYTDEHPDVESMRARVARLEARLAALPAGADAVDPTDLVATEQLAHAKLEVRRLEEKRADLESKTAVIRSRVEETPRTEQELASLKRDYEKLNENYTALLSKQLEAQMSGRLEQRWKGDRFRILDPANLPEKPYFPKAPLFLGLGAVLGLLLGVATSLVAEYLDRTVKDAEDLGGLRGLPLLASIPHHPGLGGSSK